ncbi:MAG: hypothetical protein E6R03_06670 [Hyphomicrobiaceae bacterium]|nr:MAG: hypothetical protein E6R03_06670 [Hyphomicrobiaceae bacterium]
MNPPSFPTSESSADPRGDQDVLDDLNGFQYAQAETPGFVPLANMKPVPEKVVDPAPGRPRPAVPARDPVAEGNDRRIKARQQLEQLVWRFPDGSARVPMLTSSRWGMYEALRQRIGADDFVPVLTEAEASAQAYRRRYLESTILLFLCLNSADTWERTRIIEHAGKSIEVEPLAANFSDFLATIRRWGDEAIPVDRLDAAVTMGDQLISLTFAAATVPVATPDDETESEEDEAEKKTLSRDGRTCT